MKKEKSNQYCDDAYLKSFGVEAFTEKMKRRYGKKYLDYRQRWALGEKLHELDFPVNLELDLIDACTLRCQQCLRSPDIFPEYRKYLGTGKKLGYDQIVRILDECFEHNIPSINIGGSGECMMHPDFERVCAAIMERGVMELRVISNGTLLNRENAEALIDSQVHFLSISIDAFSNETYGIIRGKTEMFQRVIDNIMFFLDLRTKRKSEFPMLRVTFVRQEKNKHEVEDFIKFWSSYADLIDIQTIMDFRKTTYSRNFSCNQPWKRLIIYADGHIGPCCGLPGIVFNLGHIDNSTLLETWQGKELRKIRDMLVKKDYPIPCLKCRGRKALEK